jgi:lipopolysaccharide transport system ATP-binding protein
VEFAGVERFLDTPVKRYSSGMYVRLAFAVAAHLEPEILIVDEVLAVGDAEFQKKCLGKMGDVANSGRTILFVSHNLSAVSALCSRVIVLNRGDVLFFGDVTEGINRYSRLSISPATAMVDFSHHTDERFGKQQFATWKTLQILADDGDSRTEFRMGQKMVFRLCLDIKRPSDDFEIGIIIANLQNIALHQLVSGWEGLSAIRQQGLHTITVSLPHIQLFPGDYQVSIWISLRGAYYDDAIHEALRFRIEEGRVNEHQTYFARFSKNTQVYVPSEWTCLANDK